MALIAVSQGKGIEECFAKKERARATRQSYSVILVLSIISVGRPVVARCALTHKRESRCASRIDAGPHGPPCALGGGRLAPGVGSSRKLRRKLTKFEPYIPLSPSCFAARICFYLPAVPLIASQRTTTTRRSTTLSRMPTPSIRGVLRSTTKFSQVNEA